MRVALAVVALLAAAPAAAVTIYSQEFNDPGFVGAGFDQNDTSDRFGATNYLFLNNFAGWSFAPSATFLAQSAGGTDGAVLLNENGPGGSASVNISGLTAGQVYSLGFLLSGDNIPGGSYVLNVGVDGNQLASISGVDGASATTSGIYEKLSFVAAGASATLAFTQASQSPASPIIDNVTVSTTVPEPATWGLMLVGFCLAGTAIRSRRVYSVT